MFALESNFSRDIIQCSEKFLQQNKLKLKLKILSINLREKNRSHNLYQSPPRSKLLTIYMSIYLFNETF